MNEQRDWLVGAFETASETLRELLNTPQITSLHFEFDCEAGEIPTMTYRIKRLSLKEGDAQEIAEAEREYIKS